MISCLQNYIGLKNITTPVSGRFINELPGIETTQFDLIRKEETYNVEVAWEDVETRAINKFEQKIKRWASRYFKNYSYIQSTVTGQYDNNTAVPTSDNYKGWLFDGNWSYYKNMRLVLEYVDLWVEESTTDTIYIFNAATGETLDTITHEFTGNQVNRVRIGKTYALHRYPKIFIAYDANNLTSRVADNLSFTNGCNDNYYPLSLSKKRINTASQIIDSNLVADDNTAMIMQFNIDCSIDNWVCQRLSLFEEAYLYYLGIEFCNERLYSDRINQYTLLDREDAEALRTEFTDYADETINRTLEALNWDQDDYCFECNRSVMYKYSMP